MKRIIRNIAAILVGMTFVLGYSSCDVDLLDTTPSSSISSANVWESPILARAAVMGVYNELYEKFSKNCTGQTLGIPYDAFSSVMDIDMNWKNRGVL